MKPHVAHASIYCCIAQEGRGSTASPAGVRVPADSRPTWMEFYAPPRQVVPRTGVEYVLTAERLRKMEEVITQTMEDVKKLQDATDLISIQAAPWSVSIETAVAASEAKATGALAEVRALYEATKTEVADLRRRASEVEKRSSSDKKSK